MRTPTQIFEELLDAYDGYATDRIMATSTADECEARLELHLADVRKYREEFREANEEGIMQALRTAQSFEDSRGAVEPAEEAEARIPDAPQPAQVIDLMAALKASHRYYAAMVSELKPGEALTISRDALERVEPLRHNGCVWTPAERILENVVGSAYEFTLHADLLTGHVVFERLSASAAAELQKTGGRTHVAPDRRDRFVLRGGAYYPRESNG